MNKVKFTVYGTPVAKGRPRIGKWGAYTPEKTVNYENLVKLSYIQECGNAKLDGALKMQVKAYFPIPKSTPKKTKVKMETETYPHTKRSDADNVLKSIADALNAVAYDDDAQISSVSIIKRYSNTPRVEISIEEDI